MTKQPTLAQSVGEKGKLFVQQAYAELPPAIMAQLVDSAIWQEGLRRYALATHLAVALVDAQGQLIGTCINPQPTWSLLRAQIPAAQGACAFSLASLKPCTCVVEALAKSEPVLARDRTGLVHFAVPLLVGGHQLGALVAGQVFDQYPEQLLLEHFAKKFNLSAQKIWQSARLEYPVKRATLRVYADLLANLSHTFLQTRYQMVIEAKRLAEMTQLRDLLLQRTQQLSESNSRTSEALALLDTLLLTAPVGFAFWDRELRFVRINKTLAAINGLTPAEHIGRTVKEIIPQIGEGVFKDLRQVLETGEPILNREVSGETPAAPGIQRYWQASYYPVLGSGDKPLGVGGVVEDITERKHSEDQLKTLATRLERSNRELQDFAAVASHDLQEPLRKIQTFGDRLQALCNEKLTEQERDYVARMQKAAHRMQNLITDLLALSQITSKARPFVEVNLQALANLVVADLEVLVRETGGRVEVGELCTIEADPTQMRQLLQNLIGNALKFHRRGVPPLVKLQAQVLSKASSAEGERLCQITVEDNGIGFDERHAERIFAAFERLHDKGEYRGTGIGLAICRKIVERHGGSVTARSTVGQGSTFIVTLPVRLPPPSEVTRKRAP